MREIPKEELDKILKEHALWLADKEGGKKANLRGADLHGANLRGADLHGADLSWANLRWADLHGADLSEAGLHGANLSGADLRGANLSGADLRGADLHEADLRGADLHEADLRGADLDFACWPLWCGSLRGAIIDDRIAKQLLYHTLSVINGPYVSQEIKAAALTPELLTVANEFHRVGECGEITTEKED